MEINNFRGEADKDSFSLKNAFFRSMDEKISLDFKVCNMP